MSHSGLFSSLGCSASFLKGFGIGDEAVEEGLTRLVGIDIVTLPGVEGGVLERASEAERDWPWEGAMRDDGCEIVGGLFNGLATREEDDTGKFGGDVGFENFCGGFADFLWSGLVFELFAGKDHVDFEEAGFEIDFLSVECIEEGA